MYRFKDHCTLFALHLFFMGTLLSSSLFSDENNALDWLEGSSTSFHGERRRFTTEFITTVEVSADSSYPHFYGNSPLIKYVNQNVEADAKTLFEEFVDYEKNTDEQYTNDFGGCFMDYDLYPVYCLPKLISIYGSEFQARDCPHGWTHHHGKNFWWYGNNIIEISLKDLFVKESNWCNFLLHYCDNHFRLLRYGYYGLEDFEPELKPDDLDVFILNEAGLTIIFPSYRVGGWADGPDVITIPYDKLAGFIDPKGPLNEIPSVNSLLNNFNSADLR